ncbi:MAG TPA: hypothetical protein VMH30_04365 [Verrucomicrobiae bacterium]|nr:hypothetical protein [Verrucomicrobiae bacterium]
MRPGAMRASFSFKLFLVTTAAFVAGYYMIASVSIGGLMPYNFRAADVIRQDCPFHIIPVAMMSGSNQADILFRWSIAETYARLGALVALWTVMVALLIWRHLEKLRHDA